MALSVNTLAIFKGDTPLKAVNTMSFYVILCLFYGFEAREAVFEPKM